MSSVFLKYFKNTSWVFVDQAFKAFSSLVVGVFIARYLGPEKFGTLSFAIALVAILLAVSRLGMDSILIRELVRTPEQKTELKSVAFTLMLISSVVGFIFLVFFSWIVVDGFDSRICITIIAFSAIFQSFLVIDYDFQSQIKAKYSSISKSLALFVSCIFKIALLLACANLYVIAMSYVLEMLLIALSLFFMNKANGGGGICFVFDRDIARHLLKSSVPMVTSALAIILYMRTDQIMIKYFLGEYQLGIYSASCRIYEGYIMIPVVLSTALFPAIVKLKAGSVKNYELNMARLYSLVFWTGIFVSLISYAWGRPIIEFVFGDAYLHAVGAFKVMMCSTAFAAFGSVTARHLTVENMEKKIAFRTIVALVLNVLLNIFLIPRAGIKGAAISTFICIFTANYLIDYFDGQLKRVVRIKNNAILFGLLK